MPDARTIQLRGETWKLCWHTVPVRESESRRFYAAVTEKLNRQWLHAHVKSVLILNAIRVLLFAPELSTKGVPGWVALLQVETQWPWFLLPVTSSFPSSKARTWMVLLRKYWGSSGSSTRNTSARARHTASLWREVELYDLSRCPVMVYRSCDIGLVNTMHRVCHIDQMSIVSPYEHTEYAHAFPWEDYTKSHQVTALLIVQDL